MCDKALWDSFLQMEKNVDKYKSNWGSLLEYLDMSASANVTGVLVSALDKISDKPVDNHYSTRAHSLQTKPNLSKYPFRL